MLSNTKPVIMWKYARTVYHFGGMDGQTFIENPNFIEFLLRSYQEYKCNDYHLDCLIEENQYFIVSPKDIVVASLYENDDRIQWLIEHG